MQLNTNTTVAYSRVIPRMATLSSLDIIVSLVKDSTRMLYSVFVCRLLIVASCDMLVAC